MTAPRRLLPRPAALTVTDDAGGAHRFDPPTIGVPWIIVEREATARSIRRQQMMMGWDQEMGMVMGVLVGALIVTSRVVGLPDSLMFAAALGIGSVSAWIMWGQVHRRIEAHWDSLGRQWTDAGLTRGRCPVCLYSLSGAEADAHDLTRCAECGAAWRRDRICQLPDHPLPRWRRVLNSMVSAEMKRTLQDDTGRKFAADRLGIIASRAGASDPQVARTVRDVRAAGVWVRILAAAAVGGVLLVPFGIVLLMAGTALKPTIWLFLVIAWVLPALLLIGVIGHSDLGLTAGSRRRRLLAAGLCPVCAGRDLAPNEDRADLSTCATCGAAWRVDAA